VRLIADSGVPACEVIVLDGRFGLVAQAVSKIDVALPPGLYKVRYKIGRTVTESSVVELEPGAEPYVVPLPHLAVHTARPTRDDPHSAAQPDIASRLSQNVDKYVGKGAELFVFVRDATEGSHHVRPTGLTLVDRDGVQVADLADSHGDEECAGYTLGLNPGSYFLRLAQADGPPLEQCIHLPEGFQTQVFLASYVRDRSLPEIDLTDASIVMNPLGRGFNPDDSSLLWADSARHALASSRRSAPIERMRRVNARFRELQKSGLSAADVTREMRNQFPNPLHGIFSAYLLLQTPDYDAALLRDVIEALRSQVGDHPDVLALLLTDPKSTVQFREPPMLRSSWRLIVESTATRHDVVPQDSYAATIGNRLWGSGAYLVWRMPESALPVRAETQEAALKALVAYVKSQLSTRSPDEFLAATVSANRFTSLELTVLGYVTRLVGQLEAARSFTANIAQATWYTPVLRTARKLAFERSTKLAIDKTFSAAAFVAQMGLPYFTVTATAQKLVEKLNIEPGHDVRTRIADVAAGVTARARGLFNK
jgi:hypothetical protein